MKTTQSGCQPLSPEEIELSGGNMGAVSKAGDTVRRRAGEWTPTIHRQLAAFTETQAQLQSRADLLGHAALYRSDAAAIRSR